MKICFTVCAALLICITFVPVAARADTPSVTKRLVEVPIADAPSYAKIALVIGIDQYELCSPLGGSCALDAKAFAALLQTKLGFTEIVLMTDDSPNPALRPTGAHLRRALQTIYGGLTAGESEVVVFYSGHGTRDTNGSSDRDYLVPSDGDPKDVSGTCIDYEAIRSKIETKNPLRALIITDACRDLLGGKGVTSTKKGFGGATKKAVADPQIAELRSCKPGEVSRVAQGEFTGSVFTHFLIQGLAGDPDAASAGTNQVTFDSLSRYVKGNVHQYVARQFNDEQTPTGLATLGAMLLARTSVPLPVVVTPPVKRILTAAQQQAANARLLALWHNGAGNADLTKAKTITPSDVRAALDAGADVNAKDKFGYTALLLAAGAGTAETVKALLDGGADANVKDSLGYTSLILAVRYGTTETVKALLGGGAEKETKDNKGNTALLFAASFGKVDTAMALLRAGADVNVKNNSAHTALYAAQHPDESATADAQAAIIAALKAAGAEE